VGLPRRSEICSRLPYGHRCICAAHLAQQCASLKSGEELDATSPEGIEAGRRFGIRPGGARPVPLRFRLPIENSQDAIAERCSR
jgi:hypothetical protein